MTATITTPVCKSGDSVKNHNRNLCGCHARTQIPRRSRMNIDSRIGVFVFDVLNLCRDSYKNHDRKLCPCSSLPADHGDYFGMREADFEDFDVSDGDTDSVETGENLRLCPTGDTAKNHHRGLCACSVSVVTLDRDELEDCRDQEDDGFSDNLTGGYVDEGDADPEEFFRGAYGHEFGSGDVDEGDGDPEDYFRG